MKLGIYGLLACLFVLVGCQAAITPPSVEPPPPPTPIVKTEPVKLVRAVLIIDGEEVEIKSQSYETNTVYEMSGELLFTFDGPVDISSLPNRCAYSLNEEGNQLRTTVSQFAHQIDVPAALKDRNGNLVQWEGLSYSLVRKPYLTATASLAEFPEVEGLYWDGNVLAPGETIKIEFNRAMDHDFVEQQIADSIYSLIPGEDGSVRTKTDYSIKWGSPSVMMFTVHGPINSTVVLAPPELDLLAWHLEIAPLQRVIVLDKDRETLSTTDVPFSVNGVSGMTLDYSQARLGRSITVSWLNYATIEYGLNLISGQVRKKEPIPDGLWWGAYPPLSLRSESRAIVEKLGLFDLTCYGLSNNGQRLATYREGRGQITVMDVQSRQEKAYNISIEPLQEFGAPTWIYWSTDDTKLFYTTRKYEVMDTDTWLGSYTYMLDLISGTETLLAKEHAVLSSSPFSEHLLTSSRINQQYGTSIIDYKGQPTLLGQPGEQLVLGKWIDASRVLISKYTANRSMLFPPDLQCYIYYLDENRWEYISEGYGFDYDIATGRIFVLQNR